MRLLLRWLLNSLALFGLAYFAPTLKILPGFRLEGFEAAVFAVAILGILNLTVAPILKLFTLPITCLTFGLFTLVINALMMALAGRVVDGFEVGGFMNALIASVIFAIITTILKLLINPNRDEK